MAGPSKENGWLVLKNPKLYNVLTAVKADQTTVLRLFLKVPFLLYFILFLGQESRSPL